MASQLPKLFYGLHFCPGIAEYKTPEGFNRIYISEEVIKQMNPTFTGKPLFVDHKSVETNEVENEADGYVVESFYNKLDGFCWAKFLAVSDKAQEAIKNGWKLSNSYVIKDQGPSGQWHNVDYQLEVLNAEYSHLAIIQNPRYEESVVLTPEQFKEYCDKKENELKKLQNQKNNEKEPTMLFFKKSKVENSEDLSKTSIVLKNGKEMTIEQLVTAVENQTEKEKEEEDKKKDIKDEKEEDKKYKTEGGEFTMNELIAKYNELFKKNCAKKNEEDEDKKKAEDKKNQKESDPESLDEGIANSKIDEIKNAIDKVQTEINVDTVVNKLARGKQLYGSK